MALFGIRFTQWENAHPTDGSRPLPYDQWEILEGYEYQTFDEAKSMAESETNYSIPRRRSYSWDESPREGANPSMQYMAFKMPPEMDYMAREEGRIAAGEYEPLPEHMLPEGSSYPFLFPRLVERDGKKLIGYYETTKEALHDRLKEVKPTKYFTYFTNNGKMWDYMAELGLITGEIGLIFLTTREDIRFAYENGPDSCMSAPAENYQSPHVHPVEAYASPDLALAVAYRGDNWKDGTIVSRALVNVNTKEYVRIYGDIERMQKLLEAEGYYENAFALGGCRLLKLYGREYDNPERERRSVIMTPYLDGRCTNITLESPRAEYLVIEEAKPIRLAGGQTHGYNDIG